MPKEHRICVDDLPGNRVEEISEAEMRVIKGGPNRRTHDTIGEFDMPVLGQGLDLTDRP